MSRLLFGSHSRLRPTHFSTPLRRNVSLVRMFWSRHVSPEEQKTIQNIRNSMLKIKQAFRRIDVEKRHINNHLRDINYALPAKSEIDVVIFCLDHDQDGLSKIVKMRKALDEVES